MDVRSMKIKILVLLSLLVTSCRTSCPRKCECLWRKAKITVDCSYQNLSGVPTKAEKDTQVLNITGNLIPLFSTRQFSRFGLVNLQKISASECGLKQVDGHAFHGLTNLVELDLSSNKLEQIPSATLNDDLPSLMTLNLNSNSLSSVQSKAFHKLVYLQKLDLSKNKIKVIEKDAFDGLKQLQRIYLDGNLLTSLDAQILPPSLHGISIHDNRWDCDCNLRSFRLWLSQSNVPREVDPVCRGPRRLLGVRVQALSLTEFACPPQLSPTSMYLTVTKGKNVSIVCRVSSDPVSEVEWYFNGQRISALPDNEIQQQNGASSPLVSVLERQNSKRVLRHDKVGPGETRSELLIQNTSMNDNGTYHCQAQNKAARSVSNFTLHITSHQEEPRILQLRLEYFVAVAVAIIALLLLVLIAIAFLLIKTCRKRLKKLPNSGGGSSAGRLNNSMDKSDILEPNFSQKQAANFRGKSRVVPTQSTKMPKHIQMGTGFMSSSSTTTTSDRPDLLTDVSNSSRRSHMGTSMTSATTSCSEGGSTSLASSNGSYQKAMENIIEDYRKSQRLSAPLIGNRVMPKRSASVYGNVSLNGGCLGRTNRLITSAARLSQQNLPCIFPAPSHDPSLSQPLYNNLATGGTADLGLPLMPQNLYSTLPLHYVMDHNTKVLLSTSGYNTLPRLGTLPSNLEMTWQQQQQQQHPLLSVTLANQQRPMMPDEQYPSNYNAYEPVSNSTGNSNHRRTSGNQFNSLPVSNSNQIQQQHTSKGQKREGTMMMMMDFESQIAAAAAAAAGLSSTHQSDVGDMKGCAGTVIHNQKMEGKEAVGVTNVLAENLDPELTTLTAGGGTAKQETQPFHIGMTDHEISSLTAKDLEVAVPKMGVKSHVQLATTSLVAERPSLSDQSQEEKVYLTDEKALIAAPLAQQDSSVTDESSYRSDSSSGSQPSVTLITDNNHSASDEDNAEASTPMTKLNSVQSDSFETGSNTSLAISSTQGSVIDLTKSGDPNPAPADTQPNSIDIYNELDEAFTSLDAELESLEEEIPVVCESI